MNIPAPISESPLVLARHAWVTFGPVRAVAPAAPQISPEDWDCLFRAVTTRLAEAGEARPPMPAPLLQALVLDCAGALRLLHAAVAQERVLRNGG